MTTSLPEGVRLATVSKDGAITLAYQTFGRPEDPPIVLVMGVATQMLGWDAEFCTALAGQGFQVMRFDNRDIGLSTHLDHLGTPDILGMMTGAVPPAAPYLLGDMADDTAGLLSALGLDRAHVVGASMGGMIVQELAMRHPDRLASLTSIMSTPALSIGAPTPAAAAALYSPPATTVAEAGRRAVAVYGVIGSPGYPLDEAGLVSRAEESFRRSNDPAGVARQFAAILASPDRRPGLAALAVPTLVMHGEADPLVQPEGGRATAEAVPGARLVTFPGMGHDLPRALWPQFVGEIAGHARAAS